MQTTMHNHPSAKQQYEADQPVREDTLLRQRQTRRRASFRERFWTKTSANYSSDDHDDNSASTSHQKRQSLTAGRTAYVPVNAASGFSRTVSAAAAAATAEHPSPPRRAHLAAMCEQPQEEEHEEPNASTTSPPPPPVAVTRVPQAEAKRPPPPPLPSAPHNPESDDYYYYYSYYSPSSHLRAETDDYAAFIAAAEAEDRARRAEWRGSSPHSKLRDSGYCSSFGGGGRHREPYAPPPPPVATAPRTLRRQHSFRVFGQRIAEYVKPTRTSPSVGSRVISELHGE